MNDDKSEVAGSDWLCFALFANSRRMLSNMATLLRRRLARREFNRASRSPSRGPIRSQMAATDRQIAANRQNAKKSTGPRTAEGKREVPNQRDQAWPARATCRAPDTRTTGSSKRSARARRAAAAGDESWRELLVGIHCGLRVAAPAARYSLRRESLPPIRLRSRSTEEASSPSRRRLRAKTRRTPWQKWWRNSQGQD